MEASSSAREPHQVNRMTCRFAGLTSGIVARAYSLLDSPRFDLAGVCRLRNNVADVLRELLKITSGLQEHETIEAAGASPVFMCYLSSVSRANPRINPRYDGLPDVGAMCCLRCALVCAGGASYSNTFVGSTIFASGRSYSIGSSLPCPRVVWAQRSGFARSASARLTALCAHDSVPDFG